MKRKDRRRFLQDTAPGVVPPHNIIRGEISAYSTHKPPPPHMLSVCSAVACGQSCNCHSFLDPHRTSLQVYLPCFVTDNFITSQRLEAVIQHRTLQVMAGLPPALQARLHERFLDAPHSCADKGEEDDAVYCVFSTVTHVNL